MPKLVFVVYIPEMRTAFGQNRRPLGAFDKGTFATILYVVCYMEMFTHGLAMMMISDVNGLSRAVMG